MRLGGYKFSCVDEAFEHLEADVTFNAMVSCSNTIRLQDIRAAATLKVITCEARFFMRTEIVKKLLEQAVSIGLEVFYISMDPGKRRAACVSQL